MNATVVGDAVQLLDEVNVGLAVDTDRGLLVVVVRGADKKSIPNITEELSVLLQRAQAGTSMPDDLTGSTFTVTNLGMFDVETFTPIINPPEMGVLGIGRIMQKPVVRSGQVIVGQIHKSESDVRPPMGRWCPVGALRTVHQGIH